MENEPQKTKKKWYLHWSFILSVILLIALGWVYFSSQAEKKAIKKDYQEKLTTLEKDFHEFTRNSSESNFMMVAQTFSWAVRKEMLAENLDPINNYFNILVKYPEVKELFLTDPQGKILLSTNKKYQDKRFSLLYDGKMLKHDKTKALSMDNKSLFIVSPVFGYESRMGTLVIKVDPEYFQSEE